MLGRFPHELRIKPLHKEIKVENPKEKYGKAKVGLDALSVNVLFELGTAMHEGALKYGKFNYRDSNIRSSIYYNATLRHLMLWYNGEDIDPDSGISHIVKAMSSLHVLRDSMIEGSIVDDRPHSTHCTADAMSLIVQGINEKWDTVE